MEHSGKLERNYLCLASQLVQTTDVWVLRWSFPFPRARDVQISHFRLTNLLLRVWRRFETGSAPHPHESHAHACLVASPDRHWTTCLKTYAVREPGDLTLRNKRFPPLVYFPRRSKTILSLWLAAMKSMIIHRCKFFLFQMWSMSRKDCGHKAACSLSPCAAKTTWLTWVLQLEIMLQRWLQAKSGFHMSCAIVFKSMCQSFFCLRWIEVVQKQVWVGIPWACRGRHQASRTPESNKSLESKMLEVRPRRQQKLNWGYSWSSSSLLTPFQTSSTSLKPRLSPQQESPLFSRLGTSAGIELKGLAGSFQISWGDPRASS